MLDLALQTNIFAEPEGLVSDVSADSCELELGCATATGRRRLLGFVTQAINVGEADFLVGDPQDSPVFLRASCNGRQYVKDFARQELLDESGAPAAGSWMALDCDYKTDPNYRPVEPAYACALPGLESLPGSSVGWGWGCGGLDITDVPPGVYTLRVQVNPDRRFSEWDYSNDSVSMRVQVPAFDDPLQPCSPNSVLHTWSEPECGWKLATSEPTTCTPGSPVRVGCDECRGNPSVRICRGAERCSAITQLAGASVLDTGECPVVDFICPEQGAYTALVTAPGYASIDGIQVSGDMIGAVWHEEPYECSLTEQSLGL